MWAYLFFVAMRTHFGAGRRQKELCDRIYSAKAQALQDEAWVEVPAVNTTAQRSAGLEQLLALWQYRHQHSQPTMSKVHTRATARTLYASAAGRANDSRERQWVHSADSKSIASTTTCSNHKAYCKD
jgi:hypothetical protein